MVNSSDVPVTMNKI